MDNELNKKLENLLKSNIINKYTKNEPIRSYQQLLNKTIELEIKNNELEKKLENKKMEIYKLKQSNIDLETQIKEQKIELNTQRNRIKYKEATIKTINNTTNLKKQILTEEDLSVFNDISYSKDNSLLIKKNNKFEVKNNNLENENKLLFENLNLIAQENLELRNQIREKDEMVNILYDEIDKFKQNNLYKIKNVKSANDSIALNKEKNESEKKLNNEKQLKNNHLNDLNFIKNSLVLFLKNYVIAEELQIQNNEINIIEEKIESKMNEIKYILLNIKKINIIFKTFFIEFTKNIIKEFQSNLEILLKDRIGILESKIIKINKKISNKNIK